MRYLATLCFLVTHRTDPAVEVADPGVGGWVGGITATDHEGGDALHGIVSKHRASRVTLQVKG